MKTPPKAAKLFRAASDSAFRGDTPTANRLYDAGNREIKRAKKPMKSFKEHLRENGDSLKSLGGSATNQYGRWGQEPVHLGVHRIEDPQVLQSLNAHIGLVNTREYIDPLAALEHVQNALGRLGYQFQYNANQLPQAEEVYPLSRFGGRQGFVDMDGVVKEDDFIEPKTGEPMVLHVEFNCDPDSSRYRVNAQILPAGLFDEEEIQNPIRANRAGEASTTGDKFGINAEDSQDWDDEDSEAGKDFEKAADRIATEAIMKLTTEGLNELKTTSTVFDLPAARKQMAQIRRKDLEAKRAGREAAGRGRELRAKSIREFFNTSSQMTEDLDVFKQHGLKIARDTIKMNSAMAKMMGGMSGQEAIDFLMKHGSSADKTAAQRAVKVESIVAKVMQEADRDEPRTGQDVPTSHQLKIARDTLKMHPAMLGVMGGPSKREAINFLLKQGSAADKAAAQRAMKESVVKEDIERTFEFSSADARDRMAKLLGLASGGKVTANDKGGKFRVSGSFKSGQMDRLINSAKQLNGKLEEETKELFTAVVLKGNKVVDQMFALEKGEVRHAADMFKARHPGAKISIEGEDGRVVKVFEEIKKMWGSSYRVPLAEFQRFKALVKKAYPAYMKREVSLVLGEKSVSLSGGYWSEGSRTEWSGLRPDGSSFTLQYPSAPPQFGGGKAPEFKVEDGKILVQGGTSGGKDAQLTFYMTKNDALRLGLDPEP